MAGYDTVETVEIPNRATRTPFALTDVMMAAPLASRLLLGATVPGRMVQAAALGAYAGSALTDWFRRRGVRRIDFRRAFGADVRHLAPLPDEERAREVDELAGDLNEAYRPMRLPRRELAQRVDGHLTDFIAGITGQRVKTSTEVRDRMLIRFLFPFAVGACDFLSGDVAILRDTGVFEPHIIAHEFSHRKGYWKELEAQALAYLALIRSGDPLLVQAARCERLHRHLRVRAGGDIGRFHGELETCGLRPELRRAFRAMRPRPSGYERAVASVMKPLYEQRMKLTGQNGLSDYGEGFTDFLYTMERRAAKRRRVPIR